MNNDQCGNSEHPNGAWHTASPMPFSNQWGKRLKQWWNMLKHGCSCDVEDFTQSYTHVNPPPPPPTENPTNKCLTKQTEALMYIASLKNGVDYVFTRKELDIKLEDAVKTARETLGIKREDEIL